MKAQILSLITFCVLTYGCNTKPADKTSTTDSLHNEGNTLATIENPDQAASQNQELGEALLKNESFGSLKLGLSAAQTKKAFGTPEEISKAAEWEADGETHQQWTYKKQGITLDMIGKEEKAINTISITDPCKLRTKQDIGICSTTEEVIAAYNDAIDKSLIEPELIIAGTEFGGLIFKFENDKVTTIFVGAAAE